MVSWDEHTLPVGTRVRLREYAETIIRTYQPGDTGVVERWVSGSCIAINWDGSGLDRFGLYAHRFDKDDTGDPW